MIIKLREKKETGFSLLELSVAVGVSAIVATAGIVASTAFIGSAQDKRDSYVSNAETSIEDAESSSLALGAVGDVTSNTSTQQAEGVFMDDNFEDSTGIAQHIQHYNNTYGVDDLYDVFVSIGNNNDAGITELREIGAAAGSGPLATYAQAPDAVVLAWASDMAAVGYEIGFNNGYVYAWACKTMSDTASVGNPWSCPDYDGDGDYLNDMWYYTVQMGNYGVVYDTFG